MGKKNRFRSKLILAAVMLPFFILNGFGQTTTNASLSGTVQDTSQAVLSGATVTVTNNNTGVKAATSTNAAGVYNFPSLQPGTYKVSAEMAGFQTNTKTDVRLDLGSRARLNFELAVKGVATQIEITSTAQDMLLESSSTTGTILQEKTVTALPLVGNDMMTLINVMGGVVKAEDAIFGNATQTFAGVAAPNINLQRDGITINEVRWVSGVVSPGRLNPEMVSEFKMVLSPVDAEMGRGAGQVQVLTKSGSNAYHGSGVWNVMNTKLDANEWQNNRTTPITQPNWRNIHNYTISAGGSIKKNKTFFFATWDHNIVEYKQVVRSPVLTPCARKGIYRYFPGWINGNTQTAINRTATIQTRPVVNADGTPLTPTDTYDGKPYTGTLQYQSVLGQLTPAAMAQIAADPINCSQYNLTGDLGLVSNSNWDALRKAFDTTGYITRFSAMMPAANDYYIGDGLNVADVRWTRVTRGQDTVFGTGEDNARKSITFKIDHILSDRHRLSGTYSLERSFSADAIQTWPNGYAGAIDRRPQTFTVSLTSTLRPTLLNEARFGLAYDISHTEEPLSNPQTGQQMADLLQKLMPTKGWPKYDGFPLVIGPGSGGTSFVPDVWSIAFATTQSNPYGSMGNLPSTWGDDDWRWTIADTVTWTKGSHSLKGGAEVRLTQANMDFNGWGQFTYSSNAFPYVQGGNTSWLNAAPSGLSAAGAPKWTGLVGIDNGTASTGAFAQAYNLMDYMVGSVGVIRQWYFVNSAAQKTWNDATKGELWRRVEERQREFSIFFKDDWKVKPSLTLNLGLRYEYYGVPWVASGMTEGLVGGPLSIFGGSTGGWSTWMQNPAFDPTKLTVQQFIGPNSPHPDQSIYNKDMNNLGPAVGFAWQLPWFGKGKTTLRGGYQISYVSMDTSDPNAGYGLVIANAPGTIYSHNYSGDSSKPYLDLSMLPNLVPTAQFIDPSIQPLLVRPVTDRSQSITVYDPNVRSPYIQNLTMALTRNIGSSLTLDVRYIGTLSRKLISSQNLNAANFINNGLAAAFDAARAGGGSDLLNKLILPNTLLANTASGAAQLRGSSGTRTNLATGNYAALAGTLATSNGLVTTTSGVLGNLLRNSGTPENFIYTNPQFSSALWRSNLAHSNYHSMQAQVTLRPTHNLSFQASYTWSRNLGDTGTITDVLNRARDYGILAQHRSHSLTTYGTYTLPFGTNGLILRDSPKAVKKIVEGWQLSWITTLTSGLPTSVTTISSMWAGSGVDIVRPDLFNTKGGHVTWDDGAFSGRYYGSMYTQVTDPQCAKVASNLQTYCSNGLHALALASDPTQIVFQHAKPGVRGNFQPNSITGPGRWGFDLAMSKNVAFTESKSLTVRVDAQNVLNHPTPSGGVPTSYNARDYTVSQPTFDLNSTNPFGYIGYKGGHRVFSANLQLRF